MVVKQLRSYRQFISADGLKSALERFNPRTSIHDHLSRACIKEPGVIAKDYDSMATTACESRVYKLKRIYLRSKYREIYEYREVL